MKTRIEKSIESALGSARRSSRSSAPPKLAAALDYAIKPGGARIRPTILTSVALACGDDRPDLTNAAAASLEAERATLEVRFRGHPQLVVWNVSTTLAAPVRVLSGAAGGLAHARRPVDLSNNTVIPCYTVGRQCYQAPDYQRVLGQRRRQIIEIFRRRVAQE